MIKEKFNIHKVHKTGHTLQGAEIMNIASQRTSSLQMK